MSTAERERIRLTLVTGLLKGAVDRVAAELLDRPGTVRLESVESFCRAVNHGVFEAHGASWEDPEPIIDLISRRHASVWRTLEGQLAANRPELAHEYPEAVVEEVVWVDPCGLATFPVWLSCFSPMRVVVIEAGAAQFAEDYAEPPDLQHDPRTGRMDSWSGRLTLGQIYEAYLASIVSRLPRPGLVELVPYRREL